MSLQIQIKKIIENTNFLSTTPYERYDLRKIVKPNQKVIIRQGDLVITNKLIQNPIVRGLRYAHLVFRNGYETFRGSHIILEFQKNTIVFHNEHGILILPFAKRELEFYTFNSSDD